MNNEQIVLAIAVIVILFLPFFKLMLYPKKTKKQLREEMVHRLVVSGEYDVDEAWKMAMEENK